MTEEQMLAGSRINNVQAQELLYNRFSPKMLGVCYRYAKNKPDAEDMLQEGFIRVFSQLHQFRGEGSLEGWIRRIIVHTCINIIKKNKKFNDCIDISHAMELSTHTDIVPSIIQSKQIVECIRLLPLGYRTVLNLFAIEGYSHKEIAQMLDIEESTSRSQYSRAKTILQEMLIKRDIMPAVKRKVSWAAAVSIF